jgi:FemAB-related protein (PEP-CTERM system-associated)
MARAAAASSVRPLEPATAGRGSAGVIVSTGAAAQRWDAYVESHPAATGYHLAAWAPIFTRAFGHETRYLAAETDGQIVGILPLVIFKSRLLRRFSVSLPFLNYGGIVADTPEAERALLEAAIAETRAAGGKHLELRHSRRHFPDFPCKQHKVAMVLPLEESEEKQWAALDRKVRNQVRKAEKSQLRSTHGGAELLEPFYDVFARNMRDLGTPVYAKSWFHAILEAFPARARIVCVWHGEQPAAASFVFRHRETMEVPWASAIREFNPLCANTYLYWEMLRFTIANKCRHFDFGRSTPGAGTYEFKRQWGAQPHELTWEYWLAADQPLPDMSPQNPRVQWAIDLWRRLPLPLTKAIGPHIVRNIP